MPINCNTLPTEEERQHCILIQQALRAIRAVPVVGLPTAGAAGYACTAAVGQLVAAEHSFIKASEALESK